jgi:hypothetical protein
MKGAKERLAIACKMEPKAREMALDDPDLEPMWQSIAEIK